MPQRIDKEELAKRIRELEGLENEEKSALLELLNTQKKYGLLWEEKTENVEESLRDSLPVLVEDKNLALTEGGDDAPNHILIEGDNWIYPNGLINSTTDTSGWTMLDLNKLNKQHIII